MTRLALVVSLAINALLLTMVLTYAQTVNVLLKVNARALERQTAVKDCELTPWQNADGTLTVIVNGHFAHRFSCGSMARGEKRLVAGSGPLLLFGED